MRPLRFKKSSERSLLFTNMFILKFKSFPVHMKYVCTQKKLELQKKNVLTFSDVHLFICIRIYY